MILEKYRAGLAALAVGFLALGCNSGGSGGETPKTGGTATSGNETASTRPVPSAPGNAVEGDTIKLGLVASQNGALRPWGVDSIAGAQLAVDEANKAGGVQGKQIQLIVSDSNSNPEQGKSAAERLVSEDKVVALLGEVASGITLAMADVAFEAGVPLIAVGATRTDLTNKGSNIFRVCYTDDFQGPVMAKFAYEELNLRNVALVTDRQQPYSKGLSDSFRKAFTSLGGTVVDEQFYESGTTDFKGILTSIKANNPDGLFMSGYFSETGPIARQAKEVGLSVKMMGGDGWDSSEILQTGGEAIVGSYFCNHYNNEENRPEVQAFLEKWRAKYGQLPGTTMGALGYDAAALAVDALKRASALNSKALAEAIENTENFAGVTGSITLKGMNGNPQKRALVVELQPAKGPRDNGQRFAKAYEPNEVRP
ncbi:MAG TPA: ABC transporter substrate-binding protein [Fimbriimonas sp.]